MGGPGCPSPQPPGSPHGWLNSSPPWAARPQMLSKSSARGELPAEAAAAPGGGGSATPMMASPAA
eukprot:6835697-Pyramimonas_sp.AAC.1